MPFWLKYATAPADELYWEMPKRRLMVGSHTSWLIKMSFGCVDSEPVGNSNVPIKLPVAALTVL